mmetsp:Transcript_5303/g.8487  ORF Transcript_5303/g.8487 Transcript_5303/m.8487 type:complete len:91 (+) Transcript_5303:481-753(+)
MLGSKEGKSESSQQPADQQRNRNPHSINPNDSASELFPSPNELPAPSNHATTTMSSKTLSFKGVGTQPLTAPPNPGLSGQTLQPPDAESN